MSAMKRAIGFQSNALSGEVVNDRKDPVGASIGQLVTDEIGRPALVGSSGRPIGVWCQKWSQPLQLPTSTSQLPMGTSGKEARDGFDITQTSNSQKQDEYAMI